MNDVNFTAIGALAGSAIGALAWLGTTWLDQHAQERAHRFAEIREHRAQLYEEFMDETSRLYADSLTHDLGNDVSKLVHIYALVGKLRLASRRIVESYQSPSFSNFQDLTQEWDKDDLDVLRNFSEGSREDLHYLLYA